MSNFHSTVSRRDFMKALGLAGFGLGAAGAATPVFHDLDELISSKPEVRENPWWIKEREFENPTTEVDWSKKSQFDANLINSWVSGEKLQGWMDQSISLLKADISANTPGNTLKDQALLASGRNFIGGDLYDYKVLSQNVPLAYCGICKLYPQIISKTSYTREELGIPKWQGTPEENSLMVAAVLHFYGSTRVGYVPITENSKKVWLNPDLQNRTVSWGDVETPIANDGILAWKPGSLVLPNKCNTAITFTIPQSALCKYRNKALGRSAEYKAYADATILSSRLQTFLRVLGYEGVGAGCGANNVGFGVLGGNGELGRTNYLINPWDGALMRKTEIMLTDLPLDPTKPIDAGIFRFCHTCKKCAESCPSSALKLDTEPSWEVNNAQNGCVGVKGYAQDWHKCRPYGWSPTAYFSGGCGICQEVCVFSKFDRASIHDVVRPFVAQTSLFNRFFRRMDDIFGYNDLQDPEEWWRKAANNEYCFGEMLSS